MAPEKNRHGSWLMANPHGFSTPPYAAGIGSHQLLGLLPLPNSLHRHMELHWNHNRLTETQQSLAFRLGNSWMPDASKFFSFSKIKDLEPMD